MKLGLALGYWGAGPPPGTAELVAAAEDLGFDSMWSAKAYGSDALTPLAWLGARTSRIKLGTSVVQMSARTPTATAMPPPRARGSASRRWPNWLFTRGSSRW